ncbi:outer membrane protein assembly factor BamD [Parapedobacter koreensis]|uniref:Beta-barrel assembly machine subunit BamD n=1 Tax=Parapedobacter koreensis TaxID=332977 RepID=A0A1H7Q535_9SPHI|nr:outer membrane protein assembly factor BamD [Parapedobacter koreensis]SEL42605.1 Beta-barrel assembly machine subunit BamD [Parapedobacter koreensis]
MFINRRIVAWAAMVFLIVMAAGCKSKFEKLRASNNIALKYQEAMKYYTNKKYTKALTLFDDLMTKYRGQAEAEDLYYYTAYTNYNLRDYTSARFHFKQFTDTYPNSARAEECRYMGAYCYFLESPKVGLDQEYTYRAIEALQLFINLYPQSERSKEAGDLIQQLRDKLETKAFNSAKLYLDMGLQDDYRAAVIAFDNVLREFPDTKYAEEMEFLSIKAQYLYANQSSPRRQEERFGEALDLYERFVSAYPESKFRKDADQLKQDSEKGLEQAKSTMAQITAAMEAAAVNKTATDETTSNTPPTGIPQN